MQNCEEGINARLGLLRPLLRIIGNVAALGGRDAASELLAHSLCKSAGAVPICKVHVQTSIDHMCNRECFTATCATLSLYASGANHLEMGMATEARCACVHAFGCKLQQALHVRTARKTFDATVNMLQKLSAKVLLSAAAAVCASGILELLTLQVLNSWAWLSFA